MVDAYLKGREILRQRFIASLRKDIRTLAEKQYGGEIYFSRDHNYHAGATIWRFINGRAEASYLEGSGPRRIKRAEPPDYTLIDEIPLEAYDDEHLVEIGKEVKAAKASL